MPQLSEIKERQQATWGAGDYGIVAAVVVPLGDVLCEAVDLKPGSRVLDVACGTGNATLAAARRFSDATGVDYVPALLQRARERAAAERLPVTFTEGDAEKIPFPDASFDVVLSTIGAMFAPDQEKVASEILRVCRPGGTVGMINWTPEGYVGQMFTMLARHVPPPPGLPSPLRWGTEAGVRELFGNRVRDLRVTRGTIAHRFRSAEHYIDFFRTYFGPMIKTFETLDDAGKKALTGDLSAIVRRLNRGGDDAAVWDVEYLVVTARKAA